QVMLDLGAHVLGLRELFPQLIARGRERLLIVLQLATLGLEGLQPLAGARSSGRSLGASPDPHTEHEEYHQRLAATIHVVRSFSKDQRSPSGGSGALDHVWRDKTRLN